jgi:hypothetical protein
MADYDVIADPAPQIENSPHYGRKTITELKTALSALDSTTYTAAAMRTMTRNDLIYAIRHTS